VPDWPDPLKTTIRQKALGAALKDLGRSVIATLGEHPGSELFTSLPRSGQINAAQERHPRCRFVPGFPTGALIACLMLPI
jgi:hypothetical protein